MKRIIGVLAAAALAGLAWAKGVEQVSVVENEITTITVPFAITSYLPSNKEVVRIEEMSGSSLRITALKRGRCDLEVRGDKELSQKYEITVLGDLATTLETLTSELDQVPEVRARIVGESIRIDGEISSIKKWEYLQKVLKHYKGVVHNFAEFTPGPDLMLRLKDTLQEAGFKVVFQSLGKDRKAWPANTIALVLNKQTHIMAIQGRVYTPEQQAKVADCLATERWLALDAKPVEDSTSVEEFRIRAQYDVFYDKPQIRVSVAYLAIGEEDLKKIGNEKALKRDGVLNLTGTFKTLYDLIRGGTTGRHGANTAEIGADLGVTANFLKQNGITRISDTGYTVMESWSKDGGKFKSGGTMFVRQLTFPQGKNVGDMTIMGNMTMQEIPYGFQINTKGGVVDDNRVDMDFKFEMSSVAVYNESEGYDRKEDISEQKIVCELGKTTFISGFKSLIDERTSPSGLPYLRNTPVLNWFVADSGTKLSDRRLVIMVCPEIVDSSAEKIDTVKEVDIPVTTEGAKTTEQREEEKLEKQYPFDGGLWNPLNWFVF